MAATAEAVQAKSQPDWLNKHLPIRFFSSIQNMIL